MHQYHDTEAIKQAAEQAWQRQPALRAEFRGNKAAFFAFEHASARGLVGRLSPGAPRALTATRLEQQQRVEPPIATLADGELSAEQLGALSMNTPEGRAAMDRHCKAKMQRVLAAYGRRGAA
jgi:hypothetical protein